MKWFFALALLSFLALPGWAQSPTWAQVEKEMNQALEKDPKNLQTLQNYANWALGAQQMAVASQLARRILQLDADNLLAHLTLIKASVASSDVSRARFHVDQVRRIDGKNLEGLQLDGVVSLLEGNAPRAIELLEAALTRSRSEKSPLDQQASYANTLIAALHQNQQREFALQRCQTFLQEYPDYGDLYISAGRLYRESGDYKRSLEVAQQGLEKVPTLYNLYATVALAQARLGNRKASEEAYSVLAKKDPDLAARIRQILDGKEPDASELKVDVK